ncbi:hypothetical protein D9758_008692 [Tetrapyrgos nigripes]|uniref:AB hydrolase-1 domain-containing protein n=1 Tax=Tetrapyrgos nigripes TaxID=182062 RepID=A0A8H5D4Y1_9AGAR|nr:hypothetical protein D9758_008692 [Tetrapyrgos nigripes]
MIFPLLPLVFFTLTVKAFSLSTSPVDTPPFNSLLFKDLNVTRGLNYHYYAVPANSGKPTLLFLHGYPSSRYDWRHQVSFFQDRGYGLIVPDMLGYGGTAKPLDPQFYASSLISKDIVDILDAEGTNQAVLIGHDWGAKIASRLANYFPERFHSFAFLSVGYLPPTFFSTPYTQLNALTKAVLGYENFGYWDFLSSDRANQILLDHLESFFDLAFTKDTVKVITDWSPLGAMEAFLANDTRIPTGDYITPEELAIQIEFFRQSGFAAANNWYKVLTTSIEADDNKGISEESAIIQKPVFLGAALRDYVAVAPTFIQSALAFTNNTLTIHEYDSSHWIMLEVRDQFNSDLLQWIEGLAL